MIVTVNGEGMDVPDGTTVAGLVELLGHPRDRVAVEVDGEICPRANHADYVLREGQTVEVVSFVGGG